MAAVEVTISGLLFDKLSRTTQNVVLIGEATLTGLGVGGGPMPPGGGGGGGSPPGIWGGGNQPFPTPPINLPPGGGGGQPPGIWGGGNVPMPSPPIANVPGAPGYEPPDKPPEPIQPPIEWKAVWTPSEGWVVVGVPNVPHPAPSGA